MYSQEENSFASTSSYEFTMMSFYKAERERVLRLWRQSLSEPINQDNDEVIDENMEVENDENMPPTKCYNAVPPRLCKLRFSTWFQLL
ncbi:unnamed protein product [Cylicostephanus goldi]|uniref:Uncharacterized protein n=1 Tax=Cylicostephanus goldi TaxID=71465 RepID=A0A3P7QIR4_CYLGO|nr:unnamed protein product [Cylicostephanus goldi]